MHKNDTRRRSGQRVDAVLRDALEPDRATVDRLVAGALEAGEDRPASRPRGRWATRRWQLAAAAVVVVLIAAALPTLAPWPWAPAAPQEASAPPVPDRTLRISNDDGPVTVTTPAGSKLVFLPLVLK